MNEQPNPSTEMNGQSSGQITSLEEAQKKIEELEVQLKDKDQKYLYLYAEFENFKKRSIKERSELIKYGTEPLAREILDVIDNLERAISHMPKDTDKTLGEGLHMVLNQFRAILQKQGIEHIKSVEQSFDPNFHEAISSEQSDHPEGTVVKEHMRGYTIHGRLLRPARVVVSGGKAS